MEALVFLSCPVNTCFCRLRPFFVFFCRAPNEYFKDFEESIKNRCSTYNNSRWFESMNKSGRISQNPIVKKWHSVDLKLEIDNNFSNRLIIC